MSTVKYICFTKMAPNKMSDDNMHAPINDMQIAEDIHLTFNHMMMSIFHRIVVNKKWEKQFSLPLMEQLIFVRQKVLSKFEYW